MPDVRDVRNSGESLARQDEALAGSNVEESLRGQHETWGDETAVENGNRPSGGVDAFQDVETNERRESISALLSSRETRERAAAAAAAAAAAVIDRSSSNTLGSGSFDALDEIKSDDDDDDGGWNDPGVGYRTERPSDGGGGGEGDDAADDEENAFFARLAAERTGVDFGDEEKASGNGPDRETNPDHPSQSSGSSSSSSPDEPNENGKWGATRQDSE